MEGNIPGSTNLYQAILDTDIISYLIRKDPRALPYQPYTDHVELGVSFATVAELFFGAYNAKWGKRTIENLEKDLSKYVVLNSNYDICRIYGKIRLECKRQPIDDPDYWIAACALYHDVPLLTGNWKHFKNISGLKIISPGHL